MKTLRKWIVRIVYGVAFATLYYIVFAFFFDTPIEHELKKSTDQLHNRYDELSASLDSLRTVIQNIEKRDSNIFEIIFEAKPYKDTVEGRIVLTSSELEEYSNAELSTLFDESLSALYDNVSAQSYEMISQLTYIDSLRNEINRIPSIQPVDNKGLTLLAASYGYKIHPFYKSRHFHQGVDYAVPEGTAVFATADGVIQSIETKGQSTGLSVLINHGKYKTFYSNLDKVLVRAGRKVLRGDIIAFSGNTGLSYAPHLHYEVRLDGKKVDPVPYFFSELDMYQHERMKRIAGIAMQSFD